MGILDYLNASTGDPQKDQAFSQGLLSAGLSLLQSKGNFGSALGQAGMAGLQGFQQSQDRSFQDAQRKQALEEMKRKKDLQALPQQYARTPEQMALANGQGPTAENAAAIPKTKPGFDMQGWLNARMGIDPEGTIALKAAQAKETPFAKVNPADYTPESVRRFLDTGNYSALSPVRKKEVVNGQVFDPYAATPGQQLDDRDPNKPFSLVGGQIVPNLGYQKFAKEKARAGASSNNVSVHTDKEFGKTLAEGLGKQIDGSFGAAKAATQSIETAHRLKSAVDSGKLVAGPGSSFRVLGLQLGQMMGVTGKDAAETLANTRTAIQSMAQAELDAAQQMKGQGQITEAERDIIRRAASGNIDALTGPEVRILADSLEKVARNKIKSHRSNVDRLKSVNGAEALLPFYQLEEPPAYAPQGQERVRRFNPATGALE